MIKSFIYIGKSRSVSDCDPIYHPFVSVYSCDREKLCHIVNCFYHLLIQSPFFFLSSGKQKWTLRNLVQSLSEEETRFFNLFQKRTFQHTLSYVQSTVSRYLTSSFGSKSILGLVQRNRSIETRLVLDVLA